MSFGLGLGTSIALGGGGLSTLKNGLLHYWNLDDDGVWSDDVGDWDLTEGNTVTVDATGGPDGGPCADNGTDGYLHNDSVTLPATGKVSWGVWVRPDNATPQAYSQIFTVSAASPSANRGMRIGHQNGPIAAGVWDTTNTRIDAVGAASLTSAWTHVVGTYDGTTMSLYKNGDLYASTDTPAIGDMQTATLDMALFGNPVNYLEATTIDGKMCMAFMYDRAIDPSEVAQHYNGGAGNRLF